MFNWLKTSMLMAAIVALFALIGSLIGGQSGMLLALGFALVMNLGAYWFSDKLVLRMYNARHSVFQPIQSRINLIGSTKDFSNCVS